MRHLLDTLMVAAFVAALIGLWALGTFIVSLNYDFFAGVFFTGLFWALISGARRIMKGSN